MRRPTQLRIATFLTLLFAFPACEQNIDLDLPAGQPRLVVEGYIEQGLPPLVLLTESQPVFTPLDPATIAASLVHGATVTVSTGGIDYRLREVAADTLPLPIRQLLAQQSGLTLDPITGRLPVPLTFYTSPSLQGETGRTYNLRIEARGQILTANTSIPNLAPLDSLWFRPAPDPTLADSLVVLWYRYRDPDTIGNAARYFTKVNREPFYTGRLQSVFTDEFVNGRHNVEFPLERGRRRSQEFVAGRSGLFRKGDTVTVRWCAIDQSHYRFWLSSDNALNTNGSPLAAPGVLTTNVKGGLGIWGGYGATYHQVVAPR